MNHLPLKGLIVLEFCQYLSGPSAGLRMADMGARVIKIENRKNGDGCRQLPIKNLWVDDSTLLFHTINRNKESFAADLKDPDDISLIKKLIAKADVITQNFRPGIMEKFGLGYEAIKSINPKIIYAEITGYGKKGPWKDKPGQDLLLQSMSGLVFTTGNAGENPVPFGISIADIICGAHLVQGVLAALIRRHKKGVGALIEVSLMESLIGFQFELFTTFYSSGKMPQRSLVNNAHPLLGAPYGLFSTSDGFIAIAMTPVERIAESLEIPALKKFSQQEAFSCRDEIKNIISEQLATKNSRHWLEKLNADGIWSAPVLDWKQMRETGGYKTLRMEQSISASNGKKITTTRCPIRINGKRLFAEKPAPRLGQHNEKIIEELF
ncbi:MAG TPA: CaiB/BaiF CoA-transferase family protein [Hanamia sp.]|nr:CaiB/BaiF CoA-transferase family protein [Hanamia sp.]